MRHLLVQSRASSNPYQTASTNTEFGFSFNEHIYIEFRADFDFWPFLISMRFATWFPKHASICLEQSLLNHWCSKKNKKNEKGKMVVRTLTWKVFLREKWKKVGKCFQSHPHILLLPWSLSEILTGMIGIWIICENCCYRPWMAYWESRAKKPPKSGLAESRFSIHDKYLMEKNRNVWGIFLRSMSWHTVKTWSITLKGGKERKQKEKKIRERERAKE